MIKKILIVLFLTFANLAFSQNQWAWMAGDSVTLTYVVGGYVRAGADTLAPKVDEVLAVQMLGLKSAAEAAPEPEAKPKKSGAAITSHDAFFMPVSSDEAPIAH